MAAGECWIGDAAVRGALWTIGDINNVLEINGDSNRAKVCSPCQNYAGEERTHHSPGINADVLLDEIERAQTANPNVNSALYLNGRIQTLEFNPDTLYVCELGVEHESLAAPPPASSRRTLAIIWAKVK